MRHPRCRCDECNSLTLACPTCGRRWRALGNPYEIGYWCADRHRIAEMELVHDTASHQVAS